MRKQAVLGKGVLVIPLLFVGVFMVAPLVFVFVMSFWKRVGFQVRPAFSLKAYEAFVSGPQHVILLHSLWMAAAATIVSLIVAYPIAYFVAFRLGRNMTRAILFLFAAPFFINYVIRDFAWTYLLGRNGPINAALQYVGIAHHPLSWLLYSDFSVLLGLVASYMPFMVFPIWLALVGIDRRLMEAGTMLGGRPYRVFLSVTLPLSLPGVFAAVIFGFVGSFGADAVATIMGGTGYQLAGNTISSAMNILNYPLAAAISSVVVVLLLGLMGAWYGVFDIRTFLGKIVR